MPSDPNEAAAMTVKLVTEEGEQEPLLARPNTISQYLATIGRKGGIKGGKARAVNLTPERKREIAQKAAQTRWKKK